MPLYNRATGIPAKFIKPFSGFMFKLSYRRHALLACADDKYGYIACPPASVLINPDEIVEVLTEGDLNSVVKIVIRKPYDARRDLVLVLIPNGEARMVVKTVWTNLRSDNHSTLRKENYAVCTR